MSASERDLLDIVVVGAGISGLTAAFYLHRANQSVALLEASDRVGGAITTRQDGDWLFELGPNTVLENHPAVTQLIRDAGLEDRKITAHPKARRRFVWKGDRLVALPAGPIGFLRTPLFSVRAKLRLLREPWIRPVSDSTDESLAEFVRRRLGDDFLDYAVGPFVSGVYAGDPERLSVRSAVPKIAALEHAHGSLIRGALAKRKGPAPAGGMLSFEDGLETLPKRMAEQIPQLILESPVQALRHDGQHWIVETKADSWTARQVILAVPAEVAANLLTPIAPEAGLELGLIPYAPVVVLTLGYRQADVPHRLGGFGFLAPRKESLRVLGCLFPSEIFPGRAREGHVALSAFAGGRTDPEIVALDDKALMNIVQDDLRKALGITARPVFQGIRRWPRAIPQYELGHQRYVTLAAELEEQHPGLYLGGNYLHGISVPDCIRNAAALAERVTGPFAC